MQYATVTYRRYRAGKQRDVLDTAAAGGAGKEKPGMLTMLLSLDS